MMEHPGHSWAGVAMATVVGCSQGQGEHAAIHFNDTGCHISMGNIA